MYLRQGWVIGNAGLFGGVLIILIAFTITGLTGLSMSSITTNIRIGAGGAYAIVAQSLGLEVGGALGIPRYLSQALAVTMYLFGLREGWLWIFPDHAPWLVDLVAFGVLFFIAWVSLDLAIKVQFLIMAVIAGSLVSVAVAAYQGSMVIPFEDVQLWGDFRGSPEDAFQGTTFWVVFAVFFPASTGIMAGANLSGDLRNPKRAIPVGTMSAIGVALLIYLGLAYWLARSASPEELMSNYTIMVERAAWGPPVLAGLIGATFSSALASLVGSARILQAMGEHRVLPNGAWLSHLTEKNEPRRAMLVTGGLVAATLLFRDLNAIAPVITLFYLITYAMINAVVFIEQSMGLVSFRPLLRLPRWVPLAGFAGSVLAMGVVNPVLSIFTVGVVVFFYSILLRRRLRAPFGDMRSGLFVTVAEWAAKQVANLPEMEARAWKPNLLVPVEDPRTLKGDFTILHDVVAPKGSVRLMGLATDRADPRLSAGIYSLSNAFKDRGVFSSHTVLDSPQGFASGMTLCMQSLRGGFFRPNAVFLNLHASEDREEEFGQVQTAAADQHMGVLVHVPHAQAGLGEQRTVNVWIRDRSPDWGLSMDLGNLDLPILVGYKLLRNWNARMRLITAVEHPEHAGSAREFLEALLELGRIPRTRVVVATDPFMQYLPQAPQADVSVFGLGTKMDFGFMRRAVDDTRSTCLFVRDSGRESVLA